MPLSKSTFKRKNRELYKPYLMKRVKREEHLRITRAVLDSSSWLRLNSNPSSIFPSSWRMACFSSTLPTPFFFVSYVYKSRKKLAWCWKLGLKYATEKWGLKNFVFTLYDSQRPLSVCWTITVLSPYLITALPITSKSLSSNTAFWSSFSWRRQKDVEDSVASFLSQATFN